MLLIVVILVLVFGLRLCYCFQRPLCLGHWDSLFFFGGSSRKTNSTAPHFGCSCRPSDPVP